MNDPYIQGFIDKCAAHGVDPQELLKLAQAPNYRKADGNQKCGNCTHYSNGTCNLYSFKAGAGMTCDSWAG
jgi:hypothetical protein